MIFVPPSDGRLRPVHELGLRWYDGIHLCLDPKVVPFVFPWGGEDMVLLDDRQEVIVALIRLLGNRLALVVLLTSSRLRLRGSRKLLSALFQLSHETALTRGVGRFPAGGAVELARLVERCLEGVLGLLSPLTTAGSPRASLGSRRSLRAGRPLGGRPDVVKPQVDVQSWLASLRSLLSCRGQILMCPGAFACPRGAASTTAAWSTTAAAAPFQSLAAPQSMSWLDRRSSMCVVELAERGAHAASGVFILGHLAEEDEARPVQGLGDLDGVDDIIERCAQVHDSDVRGVLLWEWSVQLLQRKAFERRARGVQ
jgi:hypothetical protein